MNQPLLRVLVSLTGLVCGWFSVGGFMRTDETDKPLENQQNQGRQSADGATLAMAKHPDMPSEAETSRQIASLPQQAQISFLRSHLRRMSRQEAEQWVQRCTDKFLRELAIAALSYEHPAAAVSFLKAGSLATRQAILTGWAQKWPDKIAEMTGTPEMGKSEKEFLLPYLLASHRDVALRIINAKAASVSHGIVERWAQFSPGGVAEELGQNATGGIDKALLLGGIAGEFVNKRQPWSLAEVLQKMNGEQTANLVASLPSFGNAGANAELLARSAAYADLPETVLSAIPGAHEEQWIATLAGDPQNALSSIPGEVVWTESQSRRIAAMIGQHPEAALQAINQQDTPPAIKTATALWLAKNNPSLLFRAEGADNATVVAAGILAGHQLTADSPLLQRLGAEKLDTLFPDSGSWVNHGLRPEQLYRSLQSAPAAFENPGAFASRVMDKWLEQEGVMASAAAASLPQATSSDPVFSSVAAWCLKEGDFQSAQEWAARLTQDGLANFWNSHPQSPSDKTVK